MKVLPEKKPFLISLAIAFVLNIEELFRVNGLPKFIGYIIDTLIYAIIVLVVIRVIMWIGKKAGMGK